MNIALWTLGVLILALVGLGFWMRCEAPEGDGGLAFGVLLIVDLMVTSVLGLAWLVLLVIKLVRH